MIGTWLQPRRPADRPRRRRCRAGRGRGRRRRGGRGARQLERLLAGRREIDLVAARPQVDARARAGSAARRRRPGPGSCDAALAAGDCITRQRRRPACPRPSSSPSIASTKPAGDREPEADARRPSARSPRRWNGWNTLVALVGRDPRALGRRRAARPDRRPRPATTRTGRAGRRRMRRRCRRRSRPPARAARRRPARAAASPARRRSTRPRVSAEALQRRGHDLVEPDRRASASSQRARLQPAHVEQVADEVVEPIGLLVDRLEELARARVASRSTSGWQQARHRRLDRRRAACAGRATPRRAARSAARWPRRALRRPRPRRGAAGARPRARAGPRTRRSVSSSCLVQAGSADREHGVGVERHAHLRRPRAGPAPAPRHAPRRATRPPRRRSTATD